MKFSLEQAHTAQMKLFNPSGWILASTSWDGTERLWDVNAEEVLPILDVPNVACFAFNPDGTLLATGEDVARLCALPTQ